jgi:predicted site-specific integrase-resolvase
MAAKTDLLAPQALAEEWGVTEQTLKNWRKDPRINLPFIKVGRAVRYRRDDVERFLAERTVAPKAKAVEGA